MVVGSLLLHIFACACCAVDRPFHSPLFSTCIFCCVSIHRFGSRYSQCIFTDHRFGFSSVLKSVRVRHCAAASCAYYHVLKIHQHNQDDTCACECDTNSRTQTHEQSTNCLVDEKNKIRMATTTKYGVTFQALPSPINEYCIDRIAAVDPEIAHTSVENASETNFVIIIIIVSSNNHYY